MIESAAGNGLAKVALSLFILFDRYLSFFAQANEVPPRESLFPPSGCREIPWEGILSLSMC